jgi:hypothetical protein
VEFGEDLITWVCLELNARALVSGLKYENLDDLNVGWLGVFTTKLAVWCGCLSHGAPDSPVHTGQCPVRQPRHQAIGFRPSEL